MRNPFTFAFQPQREVMFINEVGGSTYEEIDLGRAGANYGWPASEGPTADAHFTGPVFAYRHRAAAPAACAISGGTFYNPQHANFPASYVGRYFFADYCGGWINQLDPAAPATATTFQAGLSAPVGLTVGPDGALYYIQRGNGQVRRIRYTGQAAQSVVVSAHELEIAEGGAAVLGVKLAARPGVRVTVALTRQLSDPSINIDKAKLVFSRTDWNVEHRVVVSAAEDGDDLDDGGLLRLSGPGMPAATVTVTAIDDDRPPGSPRAVISRPRNGDTVSTATAEFFGDGQPTGATVRAEYEIDGVRRYTDINTLGHYHFGGDHNRWNTTILANGIHTLTMRVFDAQGRSGAHRIRVRVGN